MATVRSNGYTHIPARVEGYDAEHELDVFLTTDPANIERTLIFSGAIDPVLEELGNLAHDQGLFIHTASAGNTSAILAPEEELMPCCADEPAGVLHHTGMQDAGAVPGVDGPCLCQYRDPGTGHRLGKEIRPDALDAVCWVNSRRDTPTRLLFDALLASHHLPPSRIRGYENEAATPGAVAAAVRAGQADAGICSEGLATSHGLLFLPVAQEQVPNW